METYFSGDQNTGRVRIPNGRKSSNWRMVWFSNGRQPLENRTSKAQISRKLDHSVRYSNDRPFEKRTIKFMVSNCFWYSNVHNLDPHCFDKRTEFGRHMMI